MADNIAVTPGSGATIAADDVSGVLYERVKLDYGGDGASVPVDATHGLPIVDQAGTMAKDAKLDTLISLLGGTGAPAQVWKSANYTTTQTGAIVWDPAAGKQIGITSVLIASYGTTAARLILWLGAGGDTTYTAGTDQLVAAASFAPSTTSKPGLFMNLATPIIGTVDYNLMVTTDAAMSVDITVYGYEI